MIHDKYYRYKKDSYEAPVSVVSSLNNGLCGIMALLYGEGDFMKTVGIAVSAGYDCDNQAATCAGLVAVLNGTKCLPKDLVEEFKDQYVCFTRDDVPIATPISNITERITVIAKEAIISNGGRTEHSPGKASSIVGKKITTEIYDETFTLIFHGDNQTSVSGGWFEGTKSGKYTQNGDMVKVIVEDMSLEGSFYGESINFNDIPGEIHYIINSDF
jgi:hypothetical protein